MIGNPIKEIGDVVQVEMRQFEQHFKKEMRTKVALLDKVMQYILKRKGKQMRPMLVFLSAKLFSNSVSQDTYTAASLIELLHTASLVHDDVVDEAKKRRGFFSINALWKNKVAVLVGDYLLAKGLLIAVDHEQFELLKIVSTAVKQLSEGELLQMEKARRLDITEEVYFSIIEKKTAALFVACCAAGGRANGASESERVALEEFGKNLGIAFQIKDDLFDYNSSAEVIGKPVGIDIKEKKMTLPLIYAINHADRSDKKWLISTVKHYHDNSRKVQKVVDYVMKSGGIEYTQGLMYEYKDKAISALSIFQDSEAKEALIQLLNYTVSRKK